MITIEIPKWVTLVLIGLGIGHLVGMLITSIVDRQRMKIHLEMKEEVEKHLKEMMNEK